MCAHSHTLTARRASRDRKHCSGQSTVNGDARVRVPAIFHWISRVTGFQNSLVRLSNRPDAPLRFAPFLGQPLSDTSSPVNFLSRRRSASSLFLPSRNSETVRIVQSRSRQSPPSVSRFAHSRKRRALQADTWLAPRSVSKVPVRASVSPSAPSHDENNTASARRKERRGNTDPGSANTLTARLLAQYWTTAYQS